MLSLIVLAFSLSLLSLTPSCEGVFEGKLTTDQGSNCEWKEVNYSPTSVAFLLECSCKSATDGKFFEYSCEYEGNPHECEYFDKAGGAPRFFHQIANYFKERSHACLVGSVDVSKVTKICSNMSTHLLTRREAGKGRNGDPKRCSNEGSKKRREL